MTEREIEDDSFIVLGTSPTASLEMNEFYGKKSLDHVQLDDALKDLSDEAGMAFKAHFKVGDGPSPASLMVASNMVTDDKTTEELQKSFGEIIDENVILKETLKKNNESMKEQFLLIASCQEDMMKTQLAHREKFDETRDLVEKLRQENKKLKSDIVRLSDSISPQQDSITSVATTGPSSALEFVISPDDDTINKLTAQLELVEKQRRQVIVDNEKLTWQKESLEHIVDASSKERDELKEKVKSLEVHISGIEREYAMKINSLNTTIQDLPEKLQSANKVSSVSSEDAMKRAGHIQQLEAKVLALQKDLKNSQLKILELENVKLDFLKHKSDVSDTVKMYKEQIQDLNNRLREAQTIVVQPVRVPIIESDNSNSEPACFIDRLELYNVTLKHLAQLLYTITNNSSDNLEYILGSIASFHDFKLGITSADQFKSGLVDVKRQVEKQYNSVVLNIAQVKDKLSIFEGIFKDYNEILDKFLSSKENVVQPVSVSIIESTKSNQELECFIRNVGLYDRTVRHLAQLLNTITHDSSDNLAYILGSIASLHDFKLDRTSADQFKSDLLDVKRQEEKQYNSVVINLAQVKGSVATFQGIFKDYTRLLEKVLSPKENKPTPNVEVLTNGLLARSQEVENLKTELLKYKTDADEKELLQAQLALYKSDFEAERAAREQMASEKETILTDLRKTQRRNQEMEQQLQSRINASTMAPQSAVQNGVKSGPSGTNTVTGNMVYKCPKCMRFSSDQYQVMEDHFDFCLDDF